MNMITSCLKKIISSFKRYVSENWGAPFIAMFILILMMTCVSFLIGKVSLAASLAIDAYYVLIAGVALQLICFIKQRKSREEATAV